MSCFHDLIKHIRPEAFRRVLKREGWKYSSFTFASETWHDLSRKSCLSAFYRFFTFPTQYYGPDGVNLKEQIHNIKHLATTLNQDLTQLIHDLLEYSFEIYIELEDVVQRVSSYGGAGGLSVNEVLPSVFESKLRWVIDDVARFSRGRDVYAEPAGSAE